MKTLIPTPPAGFARVQPPAAATVEFVAPIRPVLIRPGGSLTVPVQLVNRSSRTLVRGEDNLHAVGGGAPNLLKDPAVAPGQTATYRVRVACDALEAGLVPVLFRFVEGGSDPGKGPVHPVLLLVR
jgi:hypothetical protein